MIYEEIFRILNEEKVKYLVVGGVAVGLHGYLRYTADVDLCIALDDKNIARYIQAVKRLGMVPRLPVKLEDFAVAKKRKEWIKNKGMMAFSVYRPHAVLEHVDVLIDFPFSFDKVYEQREKMCYGETKISVVSLGNLLKMKKKAGRANDVVDIEALESIQRSQRAKKKKK